MAVMIPQEVLEFFFPPYVPIEILKVAQFGISGSEVVLMRNGSPELYALKYGTPQISLSRQIENRNVLHPFMPRRVPKVYNYCTYQGGEAMLMEGVGGPNFHEAVMFNLIDSIQAVEIMKSILAEFFDVWAATRRPFESVQELARDPKTRAVKAFNASKDVLEMHGVELDDELVINGVDVGSLNSLGPKFDWYEYPDFTVLCHQDLNADNFLLHQKDMSQWYVADWEWVGRHDWKVSMSQAYGWWSVMAFGLKSEARVRRLDDATVKIAYELDFPDVCREIQHACLAACEKAASHLGERHDWRQKFWLLVACFLLAQLRFSKMRGRESFAIPLLGEGLKILARL